MKLVITGLGAVTATGYTATEVAHAALGGLAGFETREHLSLMLGEDLDELDPDNPVLAAAALVPDLDDEASRDDRLVLMAGEAAREALFDADLPYGADLLLFVAPVDADATTTDALQIELGGLGRRIRIVPAGHAGFFEALLTAKDGLQKGEVGTCLVGAVDSWLDDDRMYALARDRRLKHSEALEGFIPGEGAGFVVLEAEDHASHRAQPPWVEVHGIGRSQEAVTRTSGAPCLGQGLSEAILTAAAGKLVADDIAQVVCDLNGEHYRAEEWAAAQVKTFDFTGAELRLLHPADGIGDLGSAAGAVHTVIAAVAGSREAAGRRVLVFGGADDGRRGALLVSATGIPRVPSLAHAERKLPSVHPTTPATHLEELGFLWAQRDNAWEDETWFISDLEALETRIEAHARALEGELDPAWIAEALDSSEIDVAVGATLALIRCERPLDAALRAFARADGDRALAMGRALGLGRIGPQVDDIRALTLDPDPGRALGACLALTPQGLLHRESTRLEHLLTEDDAEIRRAAWGIAGFLGAIGPSHLESTVPTPRDYLAGFEDPDPAVRREALTAAAWARAPELREHIDHHLARPTEASLEALWVHGILATADEVRELLHLDLSSLGFARWEVFGALGHPSLLPMAIAEMGSSDPVAAAAATKAFRFITGVDVGTGRYVEAEAEDDLPLEVPDPERASTALRTNRATWSKAARLAGGAPAESPIHPADAPETLSLPSIVQSSLRAHYSGARSSLPNEVRGTRRLRMGILIPTAADLAARG